MILGEAGQKIKEKTISEPVNRMASPLIALTLLAKSAKLYHQKLARRRWDGNRNMTNRSTAAQENGNMVKLVAFDCDGVLFDSRQANIAFYNSLLTHFDRPLLSPATVDYIHSHTVLQSLDHIFAGYPDMAAVLDFARKFDYSPFIAMMVEEPHLREFLQFLRPERHTALATNRTTTTGAVLNYHGLTSDFDLVISAQDVSRPKPHPEAFVRILAHFNLAAHEAIYIGDSQVDERFAANAGVPFVAYRNPGLKADYYLETFAAGPDLIKTLS